MYPCPDPTKKKFTNGSTCYSCKWDGFDVDATSRSLFKIELSASVIRHEYHHRGPFFVTLNDCGELSPLANFYNWQ
jgi:hypothetical protein